MFKYQNLHVHVCVYKLFFLMICTILLDIDRILFYNPVIFLTFVHVCVGTSAVTESAACHLEGDISRFQRMPSIDSFNAVSMIKK